MYPYLVRLYGDGGGHHDAFVQELGRELLGHPTQKKTRRLLAIARVQGHYLEAQTTAHLNIYYTQGREGKEPY